MEMDLNAPNANFPPRDFANAADKGEAVYSGATGAAAANLDLWGTYVGPDGKTGLPAGMVWLELEALTTTAYVRFKRTNSAAATTTSNGAVCNAGTPRYFFVDPVKDQFIDVIAPGGAGVLKWRVCSQIGSRQRH